MWKTWFLDPITRTILGYLTSVEVTSLGLVGQNEGYLRSDVTIVANRGDLPILLGKDLAGRSAPSISPRPIFLGRFLVAARTPSRDLGYFHRRAAGSAR